MPKHNYIDAMDKLVTHKCLSVSLNPRAIFVDAPVGKNTWGLINYMKGEHNFNVMRMYSI